MRLLFLLLSAIIGTYWYVTDATRVRGWAQDYLEKITGGRVHVGSAALSIFEGLRLERVRLMVDDTAKPDSTVFSADALLVHIDLVKLLRGKAEASSILAVGPHLRLIEDQDSRQWNFERLHRRTPTTGPAPLPGDWPHLPDIRLRNAKVDYGRIGGGKFSRTGSMTIEAQLSPDAAGGAYNFRIQSRGASETMGPRISGSIDLPTQNVRAKLSNFAFGDDVKSMLPTQVQQFWEQHQLAGRVDIPQLSYTRGKKSDDDFLVQVALNGVTLVMAPGEIQDPDETWRRRAMDEMFALLAKTGADTGGWADRARWLIEPQPILLTDAQGLFTFTPRGVELQEVVGRIEGNAVRINGRTEGYAPDAPLDLQITSLSSENIVLGDRIRWVNSLPHGVREPYDHLRPRGEAAVKIRLKRATRGGRVEVDGEIGIVRGGFTFDKFPYPIDRASGRIVFGPDPSRPGEAALQLVGLRGFGVANGPNSQSAVRIEGVIAPLTPDAGVDINISGEAISNEPTLMQSFPPMTRKALSFLDAPGTGLLPRFTGDFVCRVHRPEGPQQPWTTEVDIDVRNGEGSLVAFPYYMKGVHGKLRVRQNHVEIDHATMDRDDGGKLVIDGRVDWAGDNVPRKADEPTIRPTLRITTERAPIDDNLLNALPETHRAWMKRLGLQGTIDLDGTVTTPTKLVPGEPSPTFKFAVRLRDSAIWPDQSTFVIDRVNGEFDLEPERMTIHDLRGRRDAAEVSLRGSVVWPQNRPALDLTARATNLPLDGALYQILPAAATVGWDAVKPEGTVDAVVEFRGGVGGTDDDDGIRDHPLRPDYRIELIPRRMAVTPSVFPVAFSDITGRVVITPQRVEMKDIIARRGEARVTFDGIGQLETGVWDFKIGALQLAVNEEIAAALPKSLGELVSSAKLAGTFDISFDKLQIKTAQSTTRPAGEPDAPEEMSFAVKLETRDGSLQAGVPVTGLVGQAEFAGESRRGKLGGLVGTLSADTFSLGGKPVENLRVRIDKPAGGPGIRLSDLRCSLSGGELAGSVDWVWPDQGSSRYAASLLIRDADVRQLVADAAPQLQGRLTANLTLEGQWDAPSSRRGRGDMLVEGKEMYRIPLLLGLLQITNLSLPINSPFERASVRYGVEGERITLESIELAADQMKMTGTGQIDFAQKRVWMDFVTDSTTWPRLPILGDLLRNARHELLRIRVRGTLEEPKVSAGSMTTITTTIDEVLRGGQDEAGGLDEPARRPKK